jgi:hypothetical protein
MTLEELKALYKEKGATTQRITQSGDAGDVIDYLTNDLGEGFSAREDQPIIGYEGQGMDATPIFGDKVLSGFMQAKDGMDYFYDPEGVFQGSRKSQKADTFWDTFGPIIIGAMTMGGGSAALGSYLFPSLSATAAAGVGGALVGGANAAFTDQNILKGALKGGVGSAGALQLGDTGFTLGDVNKAINFAQNPTLAGVANLASPYVTTNFDIGDTGFTTNDVLKGVNTIQALGSGDNKRIFDTITGLAKGTDFSGLTATEQAKRDANRETARLNRIEDAVLNQPASDDGSTQGIVDLISEMYPAADIKGMSQGDLAKFLEANMDEIKGSADFETLLKSQGQPTEDEGTVIVTGERPTPYISNLRTKDIISDIKDDEVKIDKLFPDANINDILQTVPGGTKKVTPTKTTTTPSATSQQPESSQQDQLFGGDPFADIKLMEQIFGGDIGYKLRSLGSDTKQNTASNSMNALAKLLRG